MKALVQLPAGPVIEFWDFSKAIAQAICPANELDLKGVDCIEGKLVTHQVAKLALMDTEQNSSATVTGQSGRLTDDTCPFDQLHSNQPDAAVATTSLTVGNDLRHGVVDVTFQYKLTDDDRRLMEKILVDLPALHYPMSEDEAAAFMNAYFKLLNRPAWIPVLITATTIEGRKVQRKEVMRQHQQALRAEVAQGRLSAVNTHHVPIIQLSIGDLLLKDQAIAYLHRRGIAYVDKTGGDQKHVESQKPVPDWEPIEDKKGQKKKPPLSKKRKQEAIELHRKLEREGHTDYTKQVAEQYERSHEYIRRIRREADAQQNALSSSRSWGNKLK